MWSREMPSVVGKANPVISVSLISYLSVSQGGPLSR